MHKCIHKGNQWCAMINSQDLMTNQRFLQWCEFLYIIHPEKEGQRILRMGTFLNSMSIRGIFRINPNRRQALLANPLSGERKKIWETNKW